MKNNRLHDFRTGFIDFLLCCFALFLVLTLIQTILINPTKIVKQEGISKNADYVIQLIWDKNVDCDLDLWVKDPSNNIVGWSQKDGGLMNLERDDLGHYGDTLDSFGKKYAFDQNEEAVTIRGKEPGKYTLNAHLYACRVDGKSIQVGNQYELDASIKVTQLNPSLREIFKKQIHFTKIFEEQTAATLTFDSYGNITERDDTLQHLVKPKKE